MTDFVNGDIQDTSRRFFNPVHIGFSLNEENPNHMGFGFKDAVDKEKNSMLSILSNSVLDHTQQLSGIGLGNSLLDTKPWIVTADAIEVKPTIEEELSKIHEELACVRKTVNELRVELKQKDEIIEQQKKENQKLKAQLKKEKIKTKYQKETIEVQNVELDDHQSQIDKLELRMNEVENDYSVRSEFK